MHIYPNGLLCINISLILLAYIVIVFKSLFSFYRYAGTMTYTINLLYKYCVVTWIFPINCCSPYFSKCSGNPELPTSNLLPDSLT